MKIQFVMAALAAFLLSCAGPAGKDGDSMLGMTTDEPAGPNCANGGVRFDWGADDNGNGTLEAEEIEGTSFICDGDEGSQTLVETSAEPAGENCTHGGLRVDHGTDADGDGVLQPSEIEATEFVCDGGPSLVATSAEPAGVNCATGGIRVDHGLDDDGDGELQANEVDGTTYVCDGDDGQQTLVATSAEPAGGNCFAGGTRVDYGLDDDGDGMLEAGEIDGTEFLCDGAQSLVSTSVEPAGANCPAGGIRVDHGTDNDDDGLLEPGEVDGTTYVCDGADGLQSLVAISDEVPGNNCVLGGTRIDHGIDDNGNGTLEAGEIDGTEYVCEGSGGFFDSISGTTTTSLRGAGSSCGTQVVVGTSDVVVRRIGALTDMSSEGNMKFLVFDHAAGDVLLYQGEKSFADDGSSPNWKYSDLVSLPLIAGGTYCIASISDVSGGYVFDQTAESAAGVTSVVANPNVSDYAAPVVAPTHFAADCGIQLITD